MTDIVASSFKAKGQDMSWLDKPLSKRAEAILSCLSLGLAAAVLGSQVGMTTLNTILFGLLVAAGILGCVDYIADLRNRQ